MLGSFKEPQAHGLSFLCSHSVSTTLSIYGATKHHTTSSLEQPDHAGTTWLIRFSHKLLEFTQLYSAAVIEATEEQTNFIQRFQVVIQIVELIL